MLRAIINDQVNRKLLAAYLPFVYKYTLITTIANTTISRMITISCPPIT
jgi:hypothetical protein